MKAIGSSLSSVSGAQRLLRAVVSLVLFIACARSLDEVRAQPALVYNIQTAWEDTFVLPATYTGGAEALGTGSSLVADSLYRWSQGYPPYPNLTEPGHWVFAGWTTTLPTSPNDLPFMGFSFTATEAVSFGDMRYTFFSGNWSDIWIGPSLLQVWASRDGFVTSSLIAQHSLVATHPFTGAEVTYEDDFSSLGTFVTGETLSVRFVASYHGQSRIGDAPGGFLYAVQGPQTNLTLAVAASAVPEPSTYAMILGGLALGSAFFCRARVRRRLRQTAAIAERDR